MKLTKKLLSIILAFVMVFGFAACGEPKEDPVEPEISLEEQIQNDPKAQLKLTLDQFPKIDGATAMLPYYEEMAARILDMPVEEARTHVECNTTNMAYNNLMFGSVDMIFCAPPSENQVADAKANGVEFESVPILNSGFVFFVNKNNPVNSLTKEQIHDIYAGKITNWKEVGGNDEEIIAYQRSEGSGSQTGLYQHVIPQSEVMAAPSEKKIGAMAGIIDAVAEYDNARAAIGYSYYYYITNMHYQEEVKLIGIDNVYPTNETISAGLYPFISKTAALFNSNQPEDSVVRQIADWCASASGTKLALDLGYVPSKDDKTVIPAYKAIMPSKKIATQFVRNNLKTEQIHENLHPDDYYPRFNYIKISGLKDTAVEDKINKTIKDQFDAYYNDTNYVPKYVGSAAKNVKLVCGSVEARVYANVNNILSVRVSAYYETKDYSVGYNEVTTFNFNLKDGSLLKLEDLFDKKSDGFEYLNSQVAKEVSVDNEFDWLENGLILAGVFKGIKDDQKFLLDETTGSVVLVFDYNTPEFYIQSYSRDVYISLQGYTDYEKFMTKDSLFNDDSVNYYLVSQNLGKEKYSPVEVPHSIFGERDIYTWNMFNTYENVSDSINKMLAGDQARLEAICNEANEVYDSYEKQGYQVSGEVSCRTYLEAIGKYEHVEVLYTYNMNYGKGPGWDYVYGGTDEVYTFKQGSDTPLELKDIFKEGVDYETIIKDSMRNSLAHVMDDYYNTEDPIDMNQPGIDEFINAAYEDIHGFGVLHDTISFAFKDLTKVFKDNLTDSESRFYLYRDAMVNQPFTYLGIENLTIFD